MESRFGFKLSYNGFKKNVNVTILDTVVTGGFWGDYEHVNKIGGEISGNIIPISAMYQFFPTNKLCISSEVSYTNTRFAKTYPVDDIDIINGKYEAILRGNDRLYTVDFNAMLLVRIYNLYGQELLIGAGYGISKPVNFTSPTSDALTPELSDFKTMYDVEIAMQLHRSHFIFELKYLFMKNDLLQERFKDTRFSRSHGLVSFGYMFDL
jgi:hypothetical protein